MSGRSPKIGHKILNWNTTGHHLIKRRQMRYLRKKREMPSWVPELNEDTSINKTESDGCSVQERLLAMHAPAYDQKGKTIVGNPMSGPSLP